MVHAPAGETAALEKLAAELTARGYRAHMITAGGGPPSLAVTNPQAAMLAETVLADAEWFWWPWADRIAPMADVPAAAARVASVLRAAGPRP